jgi:hypothetical protein
MSGITRESHYVPLATLRRWSEDGMNVWAYRLLAPSTSIEPWQLCAIKGLTKKRDLYTTFEGDQEGDDFEKFITREIEEPGQEAIGKVIGNFKMKPGDWRAVARFVAAQQMRTPMFFVEWIRRVNEEMPKTLESILSELEQKSAAQIAAETQEPDDHNLPSPLARLKARGRRRVAADRQSGSCTQLCQARRIRLRSGVGQAQFQLHHAGIAPGCALHPSGGQRDRPVARLDGPNAGTPGLRRRANAALDHRPQA